MIRFTERAGDLLFEVRVVPRAARSRIVGEQAGVLRVQLAAPPVDGAANEELVRVLAEALGVSPSAIEIVRGEKSRVKQIRVRGFDGGEKLQRLAASNARR